MTQPIFTTKDLSKAEMFLKKKQAKEHFDFKTYYATPDDHVLKFVKRIKAEDYAIYDITGSVRKDGYVVLYINRRPYMKHRFIMEAFNGPKPYGMEIDHVNSKKTDNTLSNLMYVTHAQNMEKYWREYHAKKA